MPTTLSFQRIDVQTGSLDREGQLAFADGELVAVLVRLADEAHAGLVGAWFLEAGFGPCRTGTAPVFDTLEAALSWLAGQLGPAR